jgi:hypothetical protein
MPEPRDASLKQQAADCPLQSFPSWGSAVIRSPRWLLTRLGETEWKCRPYSTTTQRNEQKESPLYKPVRAAEPQGPTCSTTFSQAYVGQTSTEILARAVSSQMKMLPKEGRSVKR